MSNEYYVSHQEGHYPKRLMTAWPMRPTQDPQYLEDLLPTQKILWLNYAKNIESLLDSKKMSVLQVVMIVILILVVVGLILLIIYLIWKRRIFRK
jgi:hypothetical protein